MTRRIWKLVIGVAMVLSVSAGARAGDHPSPQTQAPQTQAQAGELTLKVDVMLTRQRVDATAKGSPDRDAAERNLARSEALFEKGLINRQALEDARMKLRALQGAAVSSLPYTLFVNVPPTGGRTAASVLRVGVDLPGEPLTTTSKEGVSTTRRDSRYVGTQIDASAVTTPDGRFRLYISVSDSSVVPADRSKEFVSPVIRSFTTQNNLLLRPGQPVTFSVGTDPISGETLSAEVTVSVVK
jgi:hypothetical protein